MSLRTPLCDILGIDHPVMLAGMGGVSYAALCAAVSEAGGFGSLGMASVPPDGIREQMRRVKDLTDKPFGVDLLAAIPESLTRSVDIIIEEGARAFISGLGVPSSILRVLKDAGVVVIQMCGAVKHAVKGEQEGVDIVIGQGTEGGGHTGQVAGMALIPQMVEAVSIPVIAAGAITDGRGLAAALAMGAQGVWIGTRFIASREANAAMGYKQAILDAADTDTVISRSYSGKPMRVIRNAWTDDWAARPQDIKPFGQQNVISRDAGVMRPLMGDTSGYDRARDATAAGQGAGAIHDLPSAFDIVADVVAEAEATITRLSGIAAGRYEGSPRQGTRKAAL
jgi:enoyl-[acyl-carrier protein] reductase II